MKKITLLAWLLINTATAMELKCYSHEKLIYHINTDHVYYDDNFLVFYDNKKKKTIYIRGECVVTN